jgi:hypothetical protein
MKRRLFVGVVGLGLLGFFLARVEAADDLEPREHRLAESENALPLLERANLGFVTSDSALLDIYGNASPVGDDKESVRRRVRFVKAFARPIALVHEAVERGRLDLPSDRCLPTSEFLWALEIEAARRTDVHDAKSAMDVLLCEARLGALLQRAGGADVWIIRHGSVIEESALDGLRALATGPLALRPADLAACRDRIAKLGPDLAVAREAVRFDRRGFLAALEEYAKGKLSYGRLTYRAKENFWHDSFLESQLNEEAWSVGDIDKVAHNFDKDATKILYDKGCRWTLALLETPAPPAEAEVTWSQNLVSLGGTRTGARSELSQGPNWLGSQLVDGALQYGAAHLPWLLLSERVSLGATQTLLALREYRDRTGALPAKLDDLVPTYLATVPSDFDGKPLRYVREKAIVYSVGQGRKDKGGDPIAQRGDVTWAFENPTFAVHQ